QVEGNGLGDATADGITLSSSATLTLSGSLIRTNAGMGIHTRTSAGSNSIAQNTVSGNGTGGTETAGIAVGGASSTLDRNEFSANTGAGVLVASSATLNVITRNSIYGNGPVTGQVGIDLLSATDDAARGTTPFRTRN